MKILKILNLLICAIIFLIHNLNAQIGYHDAPYTRYEANVGTLANSAAATTKSYDQWALQSEASEQICVNLPNTGSSVQWTLSAEGDGLVVRYSVPDGGTGFLDVFANGVDVGDLTLSTTYSWESLWNNGNPNNGSVTNQAPKMRFDEVRLKLASKIPAGGTLRLERKSGSSNIHIDFAELESVPAAIASYGSVYTGNGSDLQTFINNNDGGGNTIFLPPGVYNVNSQIYFDADNTVLRGAGMWYTQIHFTNGSANNGGLRSNANNIDFADLYLTTVRNSRSNSYKGINGAFTSGATITNVWVEHFECGAWIAQYSSGPSPTNGLVVSNCRFRNNYADGINLCKGTRNTIVEHCSFRNNGDDDMAIWSADNVECMDNTFRYNTSENTWRASGCAIYGGRRNKAHNLLIKDNIEVALRVNNSFPGVGFINDGTHEFYNIAIYRCGTNYDLYNSPVGAIDLKVTGTAGTVVQNVKFSCINIVDSRNDAIYINKTGGDGFYNVVFENITINGTGREYPDNGGAVGGRGHMILFGGSPNGNSTYCGMNYSNRSGSASVDVNTSNKGSLSWTLSGTCPSGCVLPTETTSSTTAMTSATTFGVCDNPITLTATNTIPSGKTVTSVQFFVDGVSKGTDNSSPYSATWSNPTVGTHSVYAVTTYSDASTSTSTTQTVTVVEGIYSTATPPVIDGTMEGLWSSFPVNTLTYVNSGAANRTGAADLSATFQVTRDATYLYVLVNVTDANQVNNSTVAAENWKDDKVELYLDFGNNKSTTIVGGANDYTYGFVYNDPTIFVGTNTVTTGVTFNQTVKAGSTGYIMEVRIPWTSIGGVPASGAFFGIEVQVNDDDDGGDRDTKMAWNENGTDDSFQNPSKWGTLQIAGCANPMPVELLNFSGEMINGMVFLSWTTATEHNNEKFIIERSTGLSDWQPIKEVAGAGNSVSSIDYTVTDEAPLHGVAYYRLRQVDFDGVIAYSNVIVVETTIPHINVAPNPFDNVLTIQSNLKGSLNIFIHDVLGRLLYSASHECTNGSVSIQPELPGGAYSITIQTEAFIEQQKVIKK